MGFGARFLNCYVDMYTLVSRKITTHFCVCMHMYICECVYVCEKVVRQVWSGFQKYITDTP